ARVQSVRARGYEAEGLSTICAFRPFAMALFCERRHEQRRQPGIKLAPYYQGLLSTHLDSGGFCRYRSGRFRDLFHPAFLAGTVLRDGLDMERAAAAPVCFDVR